MDDLILRRDGLSVVLEAESGVLRFERSGKRLPWELDVRETASVTARTGSVEAPHPVRLSALTLRRLSATHLQWIGEVGGAGVALETQLTAGGLIFSVSPLGTGEAEVVSVCWPGQLRFRGDAREVCWSDCTQGALFRADGKPWSATNDWTHTACRFFGFTSDGDSLAVIVDTPFDAEVEFSDDGTRKMTAAVTFGPSMGTLAYPRRIRFLPLEGSGHVAVANAYREYARTHGLWKSFDERVDENPNVEKLRGAFVACAGYWWDDGADQVAAMKMMRKMGFEHGYLFSPKLFTFGQKWTALGVEGNRMTDDRLREIQALGYLCAPFLQVEEADASIGEEKFARDADGGLVKRWQIGDVSYYEIAKWRVPGMLAALEDQLQVANAIHFDTLTAMRLVENHGMRPYDRRGDVRLRMEIADYYRRRGKVICAESMRDWGIAHVDLSTSKNFAPVSPADPRIWTVPLTDLVYHDSTPRTHWEHHSYNDGRCVHSLLHRKYHPFGMELNDLLTASPPVLFPEGMLYEYAHREVTLPDGRRELEIVWSDAKTYRTRFDDPATQAALPKALRVCRLNERHGVARMTAHRFLDERSPFVQESEFATGLCVTVNFGDEPYRLPDGRTVDGRSALVEE